MFESCARLKGWNCGTMHHNFEAAVEVVLLAMLMFCFVRCLSLLAAMSCSSSRLFHSVAFV